MTPEGVHGSITAPQSQHQHDAIRDADGEVWARRECRGGGGCLCILGRGHWDQWEPVTLAWVDLFVPDAAGGAA